MTILIRRHKRTKESRGQNHINNSACSRNAMGRVSQRYVFAHFVLTTTRKAQVAES